VSALRRFNDAVHGRVRRHARGVTMSKTLLRLLRAGFIRTRLAIQPEVKREATARTIDRKAVPQ
jgi:hypothetical protein